MKHLSLILAFCLLAGCEAGKVTYIPDDPENPGNTGGGQITEAVYQTEVAGLSGLCYNSGRNGFFAVSDKTGVYELELDGKTRRKVLASGKDFEGVTVDYASGRIYTIEERERRVYRLTDSGLETVATLANVGTDANKGLEGLTCDQNGHLYIGNQEDPWVIIKYSIAQNAEVSRTGSLKQYYKFISDLCYDTSDNTLWIADSKAQRIYHSTLSGVPFEYQSVPAVDKAEALVVDKSKGVMWVGDDTTGKIYKFVLNMTAL